MHMLYFSLWAALLVQISWTQAVIDQNSDSALIKLTNLTQALSEQMSPLNLRLQDVNISLYSPNIPESLDLTVTNIDLTNTLRLKDMLNVFDLNVIASQWINIRSKFSANCSQDIIKYLQGLRQSTMWSVKSKYAFKKIY